MAGGGNALDAAAALTGVGGGTLGAAAGLAGGLLSNSGGTSSHTTVINPQPVMLVHGNSLYVAFEGKITKFDLATLALQSEAWYVAPPATTVAETPAE